MTTSIPSNTSKSSACRCDKDCGCCSRRKAAVEAPAAAERQPGFIGRHPWIIIVATFMVMISGWGTMVYLAVKHQPKSVPNAMETVQP